MKSPLIISKNILFPIALFGLVFTLFSVTFDLTHFRIPRQAGNAFTYLALICSFITVIVLIIDVFKNNLSTKYLWTLGFLLTGCIAGLYYLMNRDKFLKSL